ncbi:LacI family DNA-binding transcriptional regulator [Anaerocolumna aminovalerica]|jgi:LacI family transcriptional regulator|uniref:Transcriptional regulator, LacI family n=1 Tax=Anaerocolumna aminovalerica TaxID=1527 RepID=A0A1I5HKW2_9FIRM|nr:LacI family DNA-binding transcriptional regulator [Anaerocolumna aminovalerica]MBU5331390.1 LacI family transcriptional regulator [Anaerocolumna aminovalerica]MDU6263601.1 LacI family DNA-binding transcriptional regulator [Anaerocolumna aminovalerica]SFO48942.1 transcriptional regulator, LacI family [Anaerocolumna aminovalerica]
MVGIKEVAKAAGVSISTVSNVLNEKKNVGEETRERILNICKEMGYYPNSVGKTLKTGKSNTIVFNFSDFDRSFYLKIINGISDYVNDNDFDLIICTDKSSEKYMRSNLSSGSIILDKNMKDDTLIKIAGENYPIVVLDRILDNPYIKSVVVNNYDPMSELIQGVIDRGYRHFGFVGGPEQTADNKERYKAFRDVLEANRINFQQKSYFAGDYREKSGYTAAKILLLSQELPDCLVCANDNMAIGAIKAFRDNGIRVPGDIAVTGFDNCDLAEPMGLTTVSIPNYERGYIAARYLIENIRGKRNVEPFKISAKIIWRNSVSEKKSK